MSPRADPERVAEVAEIERVKKEQDRIARDQAIKLTELKNKEVVDTEALRVKDVLAQQQREIDERQRDEALADNRAKWQEAQYQEEQKRLRDAAVDIRIEQARSTAEADARLLNQLRSQGYSTANILQEYPELRYQFEKRDLVSGTLLNGDELLRLGAANAAPAAPAAPSGGSAAATSEPKFGLTREPREDDILTISHLGVTVSHHTLTKEERDSTQIPDLAFAYQVETVVSTGPLRQKLQQADLIYQIGDYPVPEFAKLAPYLDTLQKEGKPARLTYLRRGEDGDLYSDVALLSIPPTRA